MVERNNCYNAGVIKSNDLMTRDSRLTTYSCIKYTFSFSVSFFEFWGVDSAIRSNMRPLKFSLIVTLYRFLHGQLQSFLPPNQLTHKNVNQRLRPITVHSQKEKEIKVICPLFQNCLTFSCMTFVFGSNLRQWRGSLGASGDIGDDPYISPSDTKRLLHSWGKTFALICTIPTLSLFQTPHLYFSCCDHLIG